MRRKCAVMRSAVGRACGSVRGRFQLSRSGLMGGSRSGYRQLGQHCHLLESLGTLLGRTFFGGDRRGAAPFSQHFSLRDSSFHWEKVKRSVCLMCRHWLTCYCQGLLCAEQNPAGLWKELLWSKSSSANRWFHTCPVKHYRSLSFLVLTSGCDSVIVPTVFALRMCVCLLFCYHILLIRMDRCRINRE